MDFQKQIADLKRRLEPHNRTIGLASSYLLIIMVMSLAFSGIIYSTSAHEIGRQLPPDTYFTGPDIDYNQYHSFFQTRISKGQHDLFVHLVMLNVAVLLIGAFISYVLARRTLEPIEQALDAQSRFASDASHELRTPLAAIQTENEVALRNPKLNLTRAKELLASNLEEAGRMRALSDGLLRLARNGSEMLELSPIVLHDAVATATQQVQRLADSGRHAIEDKTAKQAIVLSDHDSLSQLLSILLENAIRYSPAGSAVTIKSKSENKELLVSVVDRGAGINEEDQEHIFERFYRADSSRSKQNVEGHGLGLALAAQLAEQLDSRIDVDSAPGKGSTFTIRLTLA
jgi:signal transduction histidine kinase